ncbi:MAG: hypothetical protein OXC46_02575 [Thaumarchaeota archaeon]|nr:hypothetical protein [Nitrososphaerota archaeon]
MSQNPEFFYMENTWEHGGHELKVWSKDGVKVIPRPQKPYCFVPYASTGTTSGYKDAIYHQPTYKREFENPKDVNEYAHAGNNTWEADIPYIRQCMMDQDWKIGTVPKAYVDIEVDDSKGVPRAEKDPIICIGIIFDDGREVYLTGDEDKMLDDFIDLMKTVGMIITYNGGTDVWETRSFDLPYLSKRYKKGKEPRYQFDKALRHCAFVDLYQIYKYEMGRVGKSLAGGYGLDNVCKVELGKGKIEHTEKFSEMTPEKLKEYNMQDIRILKELDEKFSFTDLQIDMARLTNLCLVAWRKNRKWHELSPLIMVDQLVLKESRSLNLVFPNRSFEKSQSIVGAFVLEPKVGLHKGVQNFDVKQMYPSIMIHERISPDKKRVIIPNILVRLKEKRAELKARYNETKSKQDYVTQYNYKVLANTIYGAFQNPSSRIYDRGLAQFVTKMGQDIIKKTMAVAKDMGYDTIYSDTDSVFLQVPKESAGDICDVFNVKIQPYELEAGEYYDSILFVGDATGGIKKRYAGLTDGDLKIVGMEAIKRNYTVLSREAQTLTLWKILNGVNVADCDKCVRNLRYAMHEGNYDNWLVITSGVKAISEYKVKYRKDGGASKLPPHARAMKMALDMGYPQTYDIQYVKTKTDVAPVLETEPFPTDIDYEWYYDRQIRAPIDQIFNSVAIQNGTYQKPKAIAKKTASKSILDFMSS